MKQFQLSMITPRGNFYDGKATIITLRISEGYVGLMADRLPLMSSVKVSQFTLTDENGKDRVGVIGNGIVKTFKENVDIIVNDVLWVDETAKPEAQKKLDDAKKYLDSIKEEGTKKEKAQQIVDFWELTNQLIK